MSHVTHNNESCHTNKFTYLIHAFRSYICYHSCICVTWLVNICDITHSCVRMSRSNNWHKSFIEMTWLVSQSTYMRECCHSFIHIWKSQVTHAHTHQSSATQKSACTTTLIYTIHAQTHTHTNTHTYTHTHTHTPEFCDAGKCLYDNIDVRCVFEIVEANGALNESCHTYEWVMSHIWRRQVTRMNESWHSYELVMSHKQSAREMTAVDI